MSERPDDEARPGADYLWDGSGPADPDVARLEEQLRSFRHDPAAASDFASVSPPAAELKPRSFRRRRDKHKVIAVMTAIAATLAVVAVLISYLVPGSPPWSVKVVEGRATVAGREVEGKVEIGSGKLLVTEAGSRAQLYQDDVGELEIGPGSEVELVRTAKKEQVLALHRGRLHATIWARPRLFQVETPAGRAIDLGCAYSLEIDGQGQGELAVENGWVALEARGQESFVPAAASARLARGSAPGVPLWNDAPEELRRAVRAFESSPADSAAISAVLAAARPRDGLTLWHLLSRAPAAERGRIYDALALAVPPPAGATRQAIVRGEREALDTWWNALGLGETSWWRLWRAPVR